jgi:3-vinyl bacteriochlorophyllide hydratase
MPLYSKEERARRDASKWTRVQAVLAPLQFLIFLISAVLVARFLMSGQGYLAATISVLLKATALYLIMFTGALWEKEVFGRYLFAPAFFWEDLVSMLVIALHTAYVIAVCSGNAPPRLQMYIAAAAYVSYVINAGQFLLKLRHARLESRHEAAPSPTLGVAA